MKRRVLPAIIAAPLLAAQCGGPSMPVPGETTADPALQSDVSRMVLFIDAARGKTCQDRKIIDTKNVELAPGHHTERWIVDRCGSPINYLVTYTQNPKGGTDYAVKQE
jgi:hypothetical protein